MIEFTVLGECVAKGRPQFNILFSNDLITRLVNMVRQNMISSIAATLREWVTVRTYTPKKTEVAEQALRLSCLRFKPRKPLAGPIRVDTIFVVDPPMRFPPDRSHDWPHVRPDVDNMHKLVLDALNGTFWLDDSQICGGSSFKIYGKPERTWIRISDLTPADVLAVRGLIGDREVQPVLFGAGGTS